MIKKLFLLLVTVIISNGATAQTPLEEAVNFHVKTIYGEPIWLFPLLDDESKIVVIDFFSTSCGPCQDYAPDFQACYESFGFNEGNVYFMGINWGNDNQGVKEFDSIFGLTFPSASGSQGGGNIVYGDYEILSYPTVVIITPDHNIIEQWVWPPDEETITNAVIAAGGIFVSTMENILKEKIASVFPNPANNYVNIEFELNNSADVQLKLTNIIGQEVYRSNPKFHLKGTTKVKIPVSELKNGFYFVSILNSEEVMGIVRISVAH